MASTLAKNTVNTATVKNESDLVCGGLCVGAAAVGIVATVKGRGNPVKGIIKTGEELEVIGEVVKERAEYLTYEAYMNNPELMNSLSNGLIILDENVAQPYQKGVSYIASPVVDGVNYTVDSISGEENYLVNHGIDGTFFTGLGAYAGAAGVGTGVAKGAVKSINTRDFISVKKGNKLEWTTWDNYPKVMENGREYAKIGDKLYTRHAVENTYPKSLGKVTGHTSDHVPTGISPTYVKQVLKNPTTNIENVVMTNGVKRQVYNNANVGVVTEGNKVITVIRQGNKK